VNAVEFSSLLRAKRVGRGRWMAKCPGHADRRASLAITEGKRRPIVFRCMSHQCSPESILEAMGLTWADILGERAITPEIRRKLADQERLKVLETRWIALSMLKFSDSYNRPYWARAAERTDAQIVELKGKLEPERERRHRMTLAIEKYGWDEIWRRFLETPKGKELDARYGL
jgi:hypothetical protein